VTWVLKMALNKKRPFFILGVLWEGLIIGRGSCANVASNLWWTNGSLWFLHTLSYISFNSLIKVRVYKSHLDASCL